MNSKEYEMVIKGYQEEVRAKGQMIKNLELEVKRLQEFRNIALEDCEYHLCFLKVLKSEGYDIRFLCEKAHLINKKNYFDLERFNDAIAEEIRKIIQEANTKAFNERYSNIEEKLEAIKTEIKELIND